jgi:two-component system, cell cycle response regulator
MAAVAPPTPALAWSGAPLLRIWRATVAVGFGFLVAHLAFGLGGPGLDGLAEKWVYDALELLAAVGCLLRAVSNREEWAAWTVLGLGVLAFALGDIAYDFVYEGRPPGVSICDAFYLAFYPACYAALALLVRSRISTFNRSVWLDGAIAALAMSALSASIVLQVVLDHTHGKTFSSSVQLAYPVADLVLLAMVIFVASLTGGRIGRAWAAVGVAFGVITVADSLFMYLNATGGYHEGTLLDALWPAALLLLAIAAWQPVEHEHAVELEGRVLAATPLVCGIVALAVLVAGRFRPHNALADALAAGAILVVFARTWLSFRENSALIETTRTQSLTDALTGLGNRRSLMNTLGRALNKPEPGPMVFAIFDLNGFKQYNDTFGHPSGDTLLSRLAAALRNALGGDGAAFRLGGDEFCILAHVGPDRHEQVLDAAMAALAEEGEGFSISAEHGAVILPDEASDPTRALRLADERLYMQKARLYQGQEPIRGILMRVLAEKEPALRDQMRSVAALATAVGTDLGISGQALEQLRLAAEFHDIGKIAVPDLILQKPGALAEDEWRFVRRHPEIGQRILGGSPSMREVADIVRSTHERWDGGGYLDGLAGSAIPLASRIISVCDAYVAMTSDRPYRAAMSPEDALAELRLRAGGQFDPAVVRTFCRLHAAEPLSLTS